MLLNIVNGLNFRKKRRNRGVDSTKFVLEENRYSFLAPIVASFCQGGESSMESRVCFC